MKRKTFIAISLVSLGLFLCVFKYTQVSAASCGSSASPSIELTSPRGGETFRLGQKIDIAWKTCKFGPEAEIGLSLATISDGYAYSIEGFWLHPNNGKTTVTLPSSIQLPNNFTDYSKFVISITAAERIGGEVIQVDSQNKKPFKIDPDLVPACDMTKGPWVKLLSPKGGSAVKEGAAIKIKWTSCSIPREYLLLSYLEVYDENKNYLGHIGTGSHKNSGSGTAYLPTLGEIQRSAGLSSARYGVQYKMSLVATNNIDAIAAPDYSQFVDFTRDPSRTCKIKHFKATPSTVRSTDVVSLLYETTEECRVLTIPQLNYTTLGTGGSQQIGPLTKTTRYTLLASSDDNCKGNARNPLDGKACKYVKKDLLLKIK